MPRVKCPHCGAGNQDATEQDTCWQCGNVLGAPVTRAQPSARPSNIDTSATVQLDPSQLQNFAAGRGGFDPAAERVKLARWAAITVGGACIVIIFVLYWLFGAR